MWEGSRWTDKRQLLNEASSVDDCVPWLKHCQAECCRGFRFRLSPDSDVENVGDDEVRIRIRMTDDLRHYFELHSATVQTDTVVVPANRCSVEDGRLHVAMTCSALQPSLARTLDRMHGIAYDTTMGQRVVIDTCVFVSALRSSRGASHRLLMLLGGTEFQIAVSVPLVVEYEDAAKRMSEATGLSHEEVDGIIDYVCSVAHQQEIHFLWRPILRDPRDDHVLELAAEANCQIIVTHNVRDFVESKRFDVTAITPGEFLRRIGGSSWAP